MSDATVTDDRLRLIAKRIEAIYEQIATVRFLADQANRLAEFAFGANVSHSKFGKGNILDDLGDGTFRVDFQGKGFKVVQKAHLTPTNVSARTTPDPDDAIPTTRLSLLLVASRDPLAALEYAVWCLGEAVMALGGFQAMQRVFNLVEGGGVGTAIGEWLDGCWSGVTNGRERWLA